jgi:hypothetical protein
MTPVDREQPFRSSCYNDPARNYDLLEHRGKRGRHLIDAREPLAETSG